MKKSAKSVLGVTLLEIMLVLAIASMIIVMSVRYYQSATANQQANSVLQQIQGIVASADQLAQATGSYSGGNVSTSTLEPLLPGGSLMTPWGTTISISDVQASSYTMTLPSVPSGVCPLLQARLGTNNHFVVSGSCSSLSVQYLANP